MAGERRERVSGMSDGTSRSVVIIGVEGLDLYRSEGYQITRRRVFFDEVELVTRHQVLGGWFVGLTACGTAFFALLGLAALAEMVAALIFWGITAVFAAALLSRVLLKLDVITVFDRRSQIQMPFAVRKARARRIHRLICDRVRAAQPAAAARPEQAPEV